ncbi:MAG: chemotaxis protein CheW [Pontixanthobacter sp.]
MNTLVVMLRIGGCSAAISACEVQSVIELDAIRSLPRTPDFVTGIAAMRSQSLTVIDTRRALALQTDIEAGERAAVVTVDGHPYALQCDRIDDVAEALTEPVAIPGGLGDRWQHAAHGLVETDHGPTVLLDIARLVRGPSTAAA